MAGKEKEKEGIVLRKKEGINLRTSNGFRPLPSTTLKIEETAKMVAEGKTRETIVEHLVERYGYSAQHAKEFYIAACEYLLPTEQERQQLVDKNLIRLEKLYEEAYKVKNFKVCREIIAELNKMAGISGNSVTIAKNNQGEEVIKIDFS